MIFSLLHDCSKWWNQMPNELLTLSLANQLGAGCTKKKCNKLQRAFGWVREKTSVHFLNTLIFLKKQRKCKSQTRSSKHAKRKMFLFLKIHYLLEEKSDKLFEFEFIKKNSLIIYGLVGKKRESKLLSLKILDPKK